MKPRTLPLLLGVATACLLAFALWQHTRVTRLRTRLADLRAKSDLQRSQNEQLRRRLRQADAPVDVPKPTAEATAGNGVTKPTVMDNGKPYVSIAELLRTDPEAQLHWLGSKKGQIAGHYGPLFRQLQLTAEQVAAFERNVLAREERQMDYDAIAAMQQSKDGGITRELADLMRKVHTDYAAAQRAILGEEGFAELNRYEQTAFARDAVNGWAGGAVLLVREPLTPSQGEQLVRLIAQHTDVQFHTNWSGVETGARGILSPAQLELITAMEPPLPAGARFQMSLYGTVRKASAAEKPIASSGGPAE